MTGIKESFILVFQNPLKYISPKTSKGGHYTVKRELVCIMYIRSVFTINLLHTTCLLEIYKLCLVITIHKKAALYSAILLQDNYMYYMYQNQPGSLGAVEGDHKKNTHNYRPSI